MRSAPLPRPGGDARRADGGMCNSAGECMFTGTYISELDNEERFVVPKPFREILARNAEEDRAIFFAAAQTLRVYSQKGVREYVAKLEPQLAGTNGKVVMGLLRATLSAGLAFYSGSGRVVIPELFTNRYGLSPGMRLTLRGCDEFFEITPLRD